MVGALNVFLFIMIISFVIDRLVRAIMFLLSFLGRRVVWLDDVAKLEGELQRIDAVKKQKVAYSLIAAIMAGAFVWCFGEIRILELLIGNSPDNRLDFFITWMTMLGGSDFIGRLLTVSGIGDIGGGAVSATQPIEVTGTLVLEGAKKADRAESET